MDREKFSSEVKNWLLESGRIKDLQTQLRRDLVQFLLNRKPLKKKSPKPETSVKDASLNLLILEHLARRGHWFTASVMASEVNFGDLQNLLKTWSLGQETDTPPKLKDMEVDAILKDSKVFFWIGQDEQDRLKFEYYKSHDQTLLAALLTWISGNRQHITNQDSQADLTLLKRLEGLEQNLEREVRNRDVIRRVNATKKQLRALSLDHECSNASSANEASLSEAIISKQSLSIEEGDELKRELKDAKEELKKLRSNQIEIEQLKKTVKLQRQEIDQLRLIMRKSEREKSDRHSVNRDTTSGTDQGFENYLQKVKMKLADLSNSNAMIDEELVKM